jgi:hypothetical protein
MRQHQPLANNYDTGGHFLLEGVDGNGIGNGFQDASIFACRYHAIWPQP